MATVPKTEGGGLRFNEGKIRFDLIPSFANEQFARVLTAGANKYGDHNWQKGMNWSTVIASMERHVAAMKRGEDFDPETGEYHSAHIMCNAAFLTEYYKIYPQGDNRTHGYLLNKRIGLDIDGVLADFDGAFKKRTNTVGDVKHWFFSYNVGKWWNKIEKDEKFWVNMPSLINGHDLPFEPVFYVTHRSVNNKWTEEWIEKNGFPCVPVLQVKSGESKAEVIQKAGINIFVEDRYDNFLDLNRQGVFTYLLDRPYNTRYDVGFRRIKSLNEVL